MHLVIEVPIIRSYYYRSQCQYRFQSPGTTIVALYNNGTHLYYDPLFQDTITHYDSPTWLWVPFRDFQEPKLVLANRNVTDIGTAKDVIVLHHMGHDKCDGSVRIRALKGMSQWLPKKPRIIPKHHILYLTVEGGKIKKGICVNQPLPFWMLKDSLPLQPIAPWTKSARLTLRF
jgi:hypothetical protein